MQVTPLIFGIATLAAIAPAVHALPAAGENMASRKPPVYSFCGENVGCHVGTHPKIKARSLASSMTLDKRSCQIQCNCPGINPACCGTCRS